MKNRLSKNAFTFFFFFLTLTLLPCMSAFTSFKIPTSLVPTYSSKYVQWSSWLVSKNCWPEIFTPPSSHLWKNRSILTESIVKIVQVDKETSAKKDYSYWITIYNFLMENSCSVLERFSYLHFNSFYQLQIW